MSKWPEAAAEATYIAPELDHPVSTEELITAQAKMLQKHPEDLEHVKNMVLNAHLSSVENYKKIYKSSFRNFDFKSGALVLVCSSKYDKAVGSKMMPWYIGPMIVLRCTKGGSYQLAELDSAISKLCFAAFCLIPDWPRDWKEVQLTRMEDDAVPLHISELMDTDSKDEPPRFSVLLSYCFTVLEQKESGALEIFNLFKKSKNRMFRTHKTRTYQLSYKKNSAVHLKGCMAPKLIG